MEDLSLVGVHEDGEHLLLSGPNGQRFRLRVDDALRAAVRRDRARLSQIQIEAEGRLRPRQIQARIRAGETAEEVAEAAGLSLEHVRKYEGPVLAEREYVAEQARRVRVRRGGGAEPLSLDETVTERLAAREVDQETTSWDAWRGDDGLWILALEFIAGSTLRQARWLYNAGLRNVTAHNDEARWLTEDEPPQPQNERAAGPVTGSMRRLATVRGADRPYDQEQRVEARPAYEEPAAVNLLDTLRERRGRRNRALSEDEERAGHPDPVREAIDTLLSRSDTMGEPPAAHPARSRPQDARDGEVLVLPDTESLYDLEPADAPVPPRAEKPERADRSDRDRLDRDRAERERSERERERAERERRERAEREQAESEAKAAEPERVVDVEKAEPEPTPVPAGRRPAASSRKQRRASVPSWDDIVFGQRRD
ncbi:DUF3071 domain-containing protein [Kineosporia rhizophila]|uniref:septation protein SepH n=1 Tax=Kineosporia TaxID=49184 RepID=UPI001E353E43|nr:MULTISPECIES: septation protein SepH [Kineosporia]MCE0537327.1 DUF3071 domain-containing protein [Kineosporia rhizophila]GLY17528.1 hypothetical protein Kisp01_45420 [Kineosporia sp. NBRC 101677]